MLVFFKIQSNSSFKKILSEALAGTRPRGADTSADAALTSELLFSSPKDMKENTITKRYILDVFKSLRKQNLIQISNKDFEGKPFIRLMRNLQHICQTVRAQLNPSAEVSGKSPIHNENRALGFFHILTSNATIV